MQYSLMCTHSHGIPQDIRNDITFYLNPHVLHLAKTRITWAKCVDSAVAYRQFGDEIQCLDFPLHGFKSQILYVNLVDFKVMFFHSFFLQVYHRRCTRSGRHILGNSVRRSAYSKHFSANWRRRRQCWRSQLSQQNDMSQYAIQYGLRLCQAYLEQWKLSLLYG